RRDGAAPDRPCYADTSDRSPPHSVWNEPSRSIPIGYYTGCSSGATSGNNENTTVGEILRTAERTPVATLTGPGGTPPGYARPWPVHMIGDIEVRVAPTPGR
ncbi:hypothetical protein ACWEGV_31885, partial [Streptomyces sp. NPDC004976]